MTASPIVLHTKYMERCFELAVLGGKYTKTNPNVGSVIVHNDKIIGEGYHKYFGGPHAEVNALASVGQADLTKLKDSTWYVSLEPCSHYGMTPPCAHTIVSSGCRKIVIGCLDPNPLVSGNGLGYLKEQGAEVIALFCEEEAKQLISKFSKNILKKPYVILKWAKSKDNFIGKIDQQTWLTDPVTGILTHKWRTEVDGILIGKNTAIIDNPSLTSRHYQGEHPIRIILDTNLELPSELIIYQDTHPTWTITQNAIYGHHKKEQIVVEDVKDLAGILDLLYSKGVYSLIVEGGSQILKSFIDQNLWDEARIIESKAILSEGILAPNLEGELLNRMKLGSDEVFYVRNRANN